MLQPPFHLLKAPPLHQNLSRHVFQYEYQHDRNDGQQSDKPVPLPPQCWNTVIIRRRSHRILLRQVILTTGLLAGLPNGLYSGENTRPKLPSLDTGLDFTHEYLDRILSEPESADLWEDRKISETASITIGELEHKGILSPLPMTFFPPDHVSDLNEAAHTNSNNNSGMVVDKSVSQPGIRDRHRTLSASSLRPLASTLVSSSASLEGDPARFPRGIRRKAVCNSTSTRLELDN